VQSFNLPLSKKLDFGVDSDGHAFFRAWDERANLHLTSDEFMALFELLRSNGDKIEQEIKVLQKGKQVEDL
jgi:hypothetical protein